MSETTQIPAELRSNFGKGFARRLRAAGKIPAVIYGHGSAPRHVSLPGHELTLLTRHANVIIELQIEGGDTELVLVKDVQRDPVRQIIEHIDLLIVKRGERVQVDVPVVVVGEPFSGTIVNHELGHVTVEVEATRIPEHIEVNVDGFEDGTHVSAGQLDLPNGATLVSDPEALVVGIMLPAAGVADEAENEEAAAAE